MAGEVEVNINSANAKKATIFDGVDDVITVTDDPTIEFGRKPFTLSCWMMTRDKDKVSQWMMTTHATGQSAGYLLANVWTPI